MTTRAGTNEGLAAPRARSRIGGRPTVGSNAGGAEECALVTALSPEIGYDKASQIAHKADDEIAGRAHFLSPSGD